MESKYACPAGKFTPWYSYLRIGVSGVVIVMFVLGIFFLFFGLEYSAFTLTIILGACFSLFLYSLLKTAWTVSVMGKNKIMIK